MSDRACINCGAPQEGLMCEEGLMCSHGAWVVRMLEEKSDVRGKFGVECWHPEGVLHGADEEECDGIEA